MANYHIGNLQCYLEENKLVQKKVQHNQKEYSIVRYDKSKLTPQQYNTVGLFRSVIYQKENLVSFAPPKSMSYDTFQSTELTTLTMEEYVEGTLINLF